MAERQWFLVLRDEDMNIESLLGPIKGGEYRARLLQADYLALDAKMAAYTDWDSPQVHAPYRPAFVEVMDLDETELAALDALHD